MMATAGTPAFVWYLMRGSGLVALVLLSVTLALGVVGVKRWGSTRWPRIVTAGLHRNVSLLAVCFLGVHILTALVDNWIGLSWFGVVIPFQSTYRPIWVGMGALALDLLIAVMATSLFRRHIGRRAWRVVHWFTWALWPVAVAHALGSGTDVGSGWALGMVATCVAMVLAAMVWRVRPAAAGTVQGAPRAVQAAPRAVQPAPRAVQPAPTTVSSARAPHLPTSSAPSPR
jgi:methionine sulfoxide reductase heme-binding subunit